MTGTSTLVVRKLNELYKASVVSCQGLSLRLQRFFLDKQRLLDGIHGVTAERLILSHAVQMVCGSLCAVRLWRAGLRILFLGPRGQDSEVRCDVLPTVQLVSLGSILALSLRFSFLCVRNPLCFWV